MPEDKRADIVGSLMLRGQIHDLPIEVKGQWNPELWTAAGDQLDKRYARYVNARGRGVYLVLWFGNVPRKNPPKRSDGRSKPATHQELEAMLRADLPKELQDRIKVFVLDASKPDSN